METCVFLSHELAEPMAGTAPTTRGWLLVEHPGPWAAKALTGSRGLDDGVGRELDERAGRAGFRAALIRRPDQAGRRPDEASPRADDAGGPADAGTAPDGPRTVFLAWTEPGGTWLRRLRVARAADLLTLDLAALAGPAEPALGEPVAEPLILVCTNGKRDRCCAVEGRPLAAALAASLPGAAWEVTHLGGHRFAPTAIVLPQGYLYGRLDPTSARAVIAAARRGEMLPDRCRGRATYSRAGQAAELAVRTDCGERRADALSVYDERAEDDGGWTVRVDHTDGRTWTVAVDARREAPARPESCGKDEGLPTSMRARLLTHRQ
ncbi:sucrase ferredoxin [Embleya sp. NBC_00888]|uniref:sucrase ferredoxin n=1 Tax=Embleya sp. NBC_00888 TaxID=2975960 RepID=UPI0038674C57|nr:sucrase ferredoxin [Embleya sp. NBC_00888]